MSFEIRPTAGFWVRYNTPGTRPSYYDKSYGWETEGGCLYVYKNVTLTGRDPGWVLEKIFGPTGWATMEPDATGPQGV